MNINFDTIWEILNLDPTPEQKRNLPAISWLFSGSLRSGRTTAMAVAIIMEAYRLRPQWVGVIDHYPADAWGRSNMLDHIKRIILQLPPDHPLRKHAEFRGSNFSVRFSD